MTNYWERFRQAVMTGETGKLASMTRFPFKVGMILDTDPVVMHDRADFPLLFAKLLNQKISVVEGTDRIVVKSMRQVIIEKKAISKKDFSTPCNVSVELFEFGHHDGKWQFTGAYLEE